MDTKSLFTLDKMKDFILDFLSSLWMIGLLLLPSIIF